MDIDLDYKMLVSGQNLESFATVNEAIQPLREVFGINSFTWTRCYWTGHRSVINSDILSARYYFENDLDRFCDGFPMIFNLSNMFKPKFHFFDDYEADTPYGNHVVKALEQEFDLCHLTYFCKFRMGYTDMFVLSFPKDHPDFGRRALEHQDFFESFIAYFMSNCSEQIDEAIANRHKMQKQPSYLAKLKVAKSDEFVENFKPKLKAQRYNLEQIGIDNYITAREADCIRALCITDNYNQIAKNLEISRQTVQKHIDSIREKLNITKKSELIHYIRSSDILTCIDIQHVNQEEIRRDELGVRLHQDIIQAFQAKTGININDYE